jgi:aminoglycoside phosphotransferase (APT) family kinase protein
MTAHNAAFIRENPQQTGRTVAESLNTAILAELVSSHVATGLATLRFTRIGTGKHNISYWVNSDRGRFVLRLAPPDDAGFLFYERKMMHQEPALHDLIRARTRIPVAEVIVHDFTRARIGRDYLLLTALPGAPLSNARGISRPQLAQALRQVGGYLRQLHALTATESLALNAYGYLGAHRPMEPQPTWAAAFQVMWNKLLDDVLACGCYSAGEAQGLRELLERHRTHFDRPVTSRLLHMDVWSQNILVDAAGNVTGLLDFDRALWGDVEIEFAVLDYCGISEPAFWIGYGRERDESPSAQIRRQFYLLYEVQKYMPIRVWRGKNLEGVLDYKRQSLALAARLGLET